MVTAEIPRSTELQEAHHKLMRPEFLSIWSQGRNVSGLILLVPGRSVIGMLRIIDQKQMQGGTFTLPHRLRVTSIGNTDMVTQERRVNADELLTTLYCRPAEEGVEIVSRGYTGYNLRFQPMDPDGEAQVMTTPARQLVVLEHSKIGNLFPFYKF